VSTHTCLISRAAFCVDGLTGDAWFGNSVRASRHLGGVRGPSCGWSMNQWRRFGHNGSMNEVMLRPIQEPDLDDLCRYSIDPEAAGEFEWTGFNDPRGMRRRWEEDGWLGAERGRLAVVSADSLAGDVSYRDRSPGVSKGAIYEIGIALFPEHRGQGVGTTAQRLLVRYLFDTTPAHRLEAYTEVENIAEQRALEKVGFEREGVLRGTIFRAGKWRDNVVYALFRD
jgi:ribosomal-protein-alanine N-acetyltransferase